MDLDSLVDSMEFEDVSNQQANVAVTARDEFHAEVRATQAKWAIKARQFGDELVGKSTVVGVGNKTPEQDYNCRLYCVLNMIKNPLLANRFGALSATWHELYEHIPYNQHMTSKNVSRRDNDTITKALKDAGMYKRFKFDSIGAVIRLIKQHAINTELQSLREANKLRSITLNLGDDGTIYYHDVEIHKLTRVYKVQIDGTSITMPHSSLEKLIALIDFIDTTGKL